jgi:hypothetical protein
MVNFARRIMELVPDAGCHLATAPSGMSAPSRAVDITMGVPPEIDLKTRTTSLISSGNANG